jgi:GNAT superfamily N-acetyltransferase
MPSRPDIVARAIEIFVRGFCFGRSRTHPYECLQVEGTWFMRDAPRRNASGYRKEEWVAYGVEPAKVDVLARERTRGRYAICAVQANGESSDALRAEYKRLGYRLLATEPLFVHRLKRIPRCSSPAAITRVRTADMAARLAKATRSRPLVAQDLADESPIRQYVATESNSIVGWVRSVRVASAAWCCDMYVHPSHRRKGIGSALLTKMLRVDRARNATSSVLLSSHTGALRYPNVGYEQIVMLYMFSPRRQ